MACASRSSSLLSGENLRLEKVRQWPLLARKERKQDVKYYSVPKTFSMPTVEAETSGNIAAIDFGTTYCSIAYMTAAADEPSTLKLNEYHPRVPTAILLKKLNPVPNNIGVECQIDSFGYTAQDKYQKLKAKDKQNYLYFERMKMRLQHDKNVDRNMKIRSHNVSRESNNEWYLIEVIAFILRHLKDEMIKHISMTGLSLQANDFDWVITVPAIWQAKGKQMMREAGYMAGFCSTDENGICYLSYGFSNVQQPPADIIRSKVSLVPEPEAAALYCQAMKPENAAPFGDKPSTPFAPEQYIVIDIGGGTVDITAQEHKKDTGEIDIVLAPQGNDCGGMMVNKEFGCLLQRILGEKETKEFFELEMAFPQLLYNDEGTLKPRLNHVLFNEFETQKESFGSKGSTDPKFEIAVKIPDKITLKCVLGNIKRNVTQLNDPDIELDEDCIYIKHKRVLKLFERAITGILECTRQALTELSRHRELSQFHNIYLVGGFGGCKYVYDQIKHCLDTQFPSMKYSLIVPNDHKLAVAQGAVLYKRAPVIHSRCVNRTYGIAVSVDYDPKIHTKQHFKYNEDGIKICDDAFLTFLQSGSSVSSEEVAVDEILPDIDNEQIVCIPFYASEESSLEYLTSRPSPGTIVPLAEKVGELQFELPKGDILYKDQRKFQVILDFSSVEITATVRYLNTNTDMKTNLNFLI